LSTSNKDYDDDDDDDDVILFDMKTARGKILTLRKPLHFLNLATIT